MVDAIDAQAELKLSAPPNDGSPRGRGHVCRAPTDHRKQRGNKPLGLLITGIKKDIVLTPRIFEKPQRLAIYGWRQLNGQPIQPLTIVHWNQYVDYSHGARLVRDTIDADGKRLKIAESTCRPQPLRPGQRRRPDEAAAVSDGLALTRRPIDGMLYFPKWTRHLGRQAWR